MRVLVDVLRGVERSADLSEVGVVMPAFNEEGNVGQVVERALAVGVGRVVCVDDASTDSTGAILDGYGSRPTVEVIHHEVNQGKQAGVRHGLIRALSYPELRLFATLDADMQNDPADLPRLTAPLDRCDVVIAYRIRDDMPPPQQLSNALVNAVYRLVGAVDIHDVQAGYRVYTREVAEYIAAHLETSGGYTLEHTTLVLFGRLALERGRDFRIGEVPVRCPYGHTKSHIRLRDNLQLAKASFTCALALARMRR
jgi:glycosyltransferase involved in cell wall biosynthesis